MDDSTDSAADFRRQRSGSNRRTIIDVTFCVFFDRMRLLAVIPILSMLAVSASLAFVLAISQSGGIRIPTDDLLITRLNETLAEMSHRSSNKTANCAPVGADREDDGGGDGVVGGGGVRCNPEGAMLRVFMYELPSEFHFGMLGDFEPSADPQNVWPRNLSDLPRYHGGLHQQHSPEYWLTADILTSNIPSIKRNGCTAVRVEDPQEADVFFVPFFASLCHNKNGKLVKNDEDNEMQDRLVKYLEGQPHWWESGGSNHVIVIHHPNSLWKVRDRLGSAMYVVSDFGRYVEETANMKKDIVAPYKHVIPAFHNDESTFDSRTTLLFFQGAIKRKKGGVIRQQLNKLLDDEPGVQFLAGNIKSNGIKSATVGMRSSKFCLHLAGDTPSSNRLFDAIASHCVPVVISDEIELPFEDVLDYSEFCLFIKSSDALKKGFVINFLRGIQEKEWTRMWLRLKEVLHYFEYQHPTLPNDAVNMIWKAVATRAHSVKLRLNKGKRYARSRRP